VVIGRGGCIDGDKPGWHTHDQTVIVFAYEYVRMKATPSQDVLPEVWSLGAGAECIDASPAQARQADRTEQGLAGQPWTTFMV
jgi:hypothetical protein